MTETEDLEGICGLWLGKECSVGVGCDAVEWGVVQSRWDAGVQEEGGCPKSVTSY